MSPSGVYYICSVDGDTRCIGLVLNGSRLHHGTGLST